MLPSQLGRVVGWRNTQTLGVVSTDAEKFHRFRHQPHATEKRSLPNQDQLLYSSLSSLLALVVMVLSPLWHIDAEKNNEGCFGAPRLIFSPGRRETSIPSPVYLDSSNLFLRFFHHAVSSFLAEGHVSCPFKPVIKKTAAQPLWSEQPFALRGFRFFKFILGRLPALHSDTLSRPSWLCWQENSSQPDRPAR